MTCLLDKDWNIKNTYRNSLRTVWIPEFGDRPRSQVGN